MHLLSYLGWFEGLSQRFLSCEIPKMLLLAGECNSNNIVFSASIIFLFDKKIFMITSVSVIAEVKC